MPKPNKYQGNGSKKPEGHAEGSYVMNKGRMVPMFRATGDSITWGINQYKAYKKAEGSTVKLIARLMIVVLLTLAVVAFFSMRAVA